MVYPSLIVDRIQQLREATRRPLFQELVKSKQDNTEATWIQLVQEAVQVYPYMTLEKRGQVWHLVSILLLAFLLPLSTGNEATLQSARTINVVDLDLEERLARTARPSQVVTRGTLMDPCILLGWHEFVTQALPGLVSLAAPCTCDWAADLLHILALIITPRVNRLELDLPVHCQPLHPTVQRLYRLANGQTAAYFYIQDGQRQELVKLLYHYWNTPGFLDDNDDNDACLAWQCGVAHVRASLGAWARRHFSPTHYVLALQARLDNSWFKAWNTALNQLVGEDGIDYHSPQQAAQRCGGDDCWTTRGLTIYYKKARPLPPPNCPHVQRGFILASLLLESCGQIHQAEYLTSALSALGDALEWQLDAWTVDHDKTVAPVSCMAAVLLTTTSLLLHLVHPGDTREHLEVYENILHCSIQFLRHDSACIRHGATKILENAWNIVGLSPTPFAAVMLTTLQQIKAPRCEWKGMVGMLSRASPAFAKEVAKTLQDDLLSDHALVAVVAANQPGTFDVKVLEKALSDATTTEQTLSLVAALVASRQSVYFDEAQSLWDRVSVHLEKIDPWNQYRMGIFALTNGEYATATKLFRQLSILVSDQKHYLWTETLASVAEAESILSTQAALGIPSAGTLLHNALAYLDGLQSQSRDQDYCFQIRFLLLRLDLLDLITVLRQIIREMRLTGQLPAKGTRTFSHVPSIFRAFLRLAKQFMDLDHRFGLLWQSRRTSMCLASFRDLAFFLAQTTRAAFGSILPIALGKIVLPELSAKLVFPINKLIRELDSLVIYPFIKSGNNVDTKTISTALLQILDGILMVPMALPRDFCAPLPVLELHWSVRPDSSHVAEMQQSSFDVVETFPSLSPLVTVEGRLSNVVALRRPVRSVVLSCQMRHIGPLEEDGGSKALALPIMPDPKRIAIDRQGEFCLSFTLPPLHEEGWFSLETFIKCQAVDGRMYHVSVCNASSPRIKIRNSRSR